MSTTASWVAEACDALGLAEQVRRVDGPERSELLRRATEAFLNGLNVLFWWEHLRVPYTSWQTEQGYKHLPRLAADAGACCWLITRLEDDDKAVFRCTPTSAAAVIAECPYFEYALVDTDLRWMVIENHHGVLFAAGDAAARLDGLRG